MSAEEKLIDLLKAGDTSAFGKLYNMYAKRISRFVFQYTGNTQDTEEIVQEIFFKVYISINKYSKKEGASFLSWLMRVSINTSLNFIKKSRRGQFVPDNDYLEMINIGEGISDPEEEVIHGEITDSITLALGRLSPRQKMVFTLKFFQGLNIPEISLSMKCSEGSARKHLYRSISKIRESLENRRVK